MTRSTFDFSDFALVALVAISALAFTTSPVAANGGNIGQSKLAAQQSQSHVATLDSSAVRSD